MFGCGWTSSGLRKYSLPSFTFLVLRPPGYTGLKVVLHRFIGLEFLVLENICIWILNMNQFLISHKRHVLRTWNPSGDKLLVFIYFSAIFCGSVIFSKNQF